MRVFPKILVLVCVFAAALALFSSINGRSRSAEPRLERTPTALGPGASTRQRIMALETKLRERPGDAELLAQLGDATLRRVRETVDASGYPRAERAYRRALRTDPRNVPATVGLGTLAMARHHFREALHHGQRAMSLAPESISPFPLVVDALVELGHYREADAELQRLIDRKPGLAAYARVSYVRELRGDLRGAVSAMRLAVSAGASAPEDAAYTQTLLGTLERDRGRTEAAQAAYRAALGAQPDYPDADAGLAIVDAARGRLGPAIARQRTVAQRLPTPEHYTLLAELELAAGRSGDARRHLAHVRDRRGRLRDAGENTDTEAAIYEADHGDPEVGVRLGRRAWAAAPSIRSANALGWALTRAGRPAEGYVWAKRAMHSGWREPLVVYHAGMSAKAAGDLRAARRLLRRLISESPGFSALYAPRARRALRSL